MEIQINQKIKDKMAAVSPPISIITINVNGVSDQIDYKTIPNYMLPLKDTCQFQRQTQVSSEWVRDDPESICSPKESECSHIY